MRRSTSTATTRYLWDGDDLVMELDANGNRLREYAHLPGTDAPHSVRRSSDGAIFYYAPERPGQVAGLIDLSKNAVNRYEYTPWGDAISTSEAVPQPLRFAAREFDTETGLYYVRARYYDPKLGRFLSEDPVGLAGGINPYVYVGNSPMNGTDPSGLSHCGLDVHGPLPPGACPPVDLPPITVWGRGGINCADPEHWMDFRCSASADLMPSAEEMGFRFEDPGVVVPATNLGDEGPSCWGLALDAGISAVGDALIFVKGVALLWRSGRVAASATRLAARSDDLLRAGRYAEAGYYDAMAALHSAAALDLTRRGGRHIVRGAFASEYEMATSSTAEPWYRTAARFMPVLGTGWQIVDTVKCFASR